MIITVGIQVTTKEDEVLTHCCEGGWVCLLQKYEVIANFTSEKCEKRPINETFRPFSIPTDAKYLDTIEIGSDMVPGAGLEVYVWGGQTECEFKSEPICQCVLHQNHTCCDSLYNAWTLNNGGFLVKVL